MNKEVKMRGRSGAGRGSDQDPITAAPGSHPVGVGLGVTGGAIAGPIVAPVGLVPGGIAGALGGSVVAEKIDPTAEDAYWKANYSKKKYVDRDAPYLTYQPAYRTGYAGRIRYPGRTFEEVQAVLESDYQRSKGSETLSWDKAKVATRDAWERVEHLSGPRD